MTFGRRKNQQTCSQVSPGRLVWERQTREWGKQAKPERPAARAEGRQQTHTVGRRERGAEEIYERIMAKTCPNLFFMLVVMIYYSKKLQMKVSKGKRNIEPKVPARLSQWGCTDSPLLPATMCGSVCDVSPTREAHLSLTVLGFYWDFIEWLTLSIQSLALPRLKLTQHDPKPPRRFTFLA